jgi:hemerythrin
MGIEWKQSLATGIEEIDNQHKELFDRVNKLFDACNQHKGKEEVGEVVKFLEDYVISHFRDEEKIMEKYSYPEIKSHKELHKQFVKDFLTLKDSFQKEGPSTHFVILMNRKVVDWLVKHIGNIDRSLGNYIQGVTK